MKAVINGKLVLPGGISEGILLIDGPLITGLLPGDPSVLPKGIEIIDAGGLYVGPGLIDQHLHGYHQYGEGFDIIENTKETALSHLKHGVTTVTPSPSYSLRMDRYLSIIDQCNEEIRRTERILSGELPFDEMPSPIAGIHLEGPYINPRQGAGRKYAWKYSDEAFRRLFTAGGKNILHCTYAPEMPHAEKVGQMIREYGVTMDIGHTEADPESMYRAVQHGAKIITHLFCATGNAKGVHAFDLTGDAQDGVSQVALSLPGLYYELICDRHHVHAAASSIRLALRCAGPEHIILVSDCTYHKRADCNPEEYENAFSSYKKEASAEELPSPGASWFDRTGTPDINLSREGRLFGSRLTVAQCAKNFMETTGADLSTVFLCASQNSAKALGISDRFGAVTPGHFANLVFVDDAFTVHDVLFYGKKLAEVRL